MQIFCIFFIIISTNCAKRFEKIEKCNSSGKTSQVVRCDIADGALNLIGEIIKPLKYLNVSGNMKTCCLISQFNSNIFSKHFASLFHQMGNSGKLMTAFK